MSRLINNGSIDSLKVYSFVKCDSRASFPLVQPNRHFCSLTPKNGGSCGPTIVYVLRRWLIAIFSLYFYVGQYMAGVMLLSRSIRPCESMHGNAQTFSQKVITSIVYDSRCWMSDVAFRTTPPIGGPSCHTLHLVCQTWTKLHLCVMLSN